VTIHFADHDIVVHIGDNRKVLATMEPGSVQCVVTSPPYFGLRDYGVEGQLGLEASPAEYVAEMVGVFREVRRVLADDGVLWLNLGDSYYSGRGNPGPNSADEKQAARRGWMRTLDKPGQDWAKPKDLLGMPWRVAFALQEDGWTLRNAVIWYKPNAMPESVADRLACRYEHVFLFAKARRYRFNLDAIKEALASNRITGNVFGGAAKAKKMVEHGSRDGGTARRSGNTYDSLPDGRNPGDVWTIPTSPFPGAHFACMPPALAERCILAGCPDDGTVLDPFAGSGTTLMTARKLGRRSVGIELNPEYADIITERIGQTPFNFDVDEVME
jgi:site-specific DNA-methyltransferase (cytosine-N4-specific)